MQPSAKILILEDDPEVAEDIRLKVIQLDHQVCAVCHTAEEAYAAIKEGRPDIALIDIVLPQGADGITVAGTFVAQGIPVIYITAYDEQEFLERAKITEPLGYLLKPVTTRDLHATIYLALYKARHEHELRERQLFHATLVSLYDPIIGIDSKGCITLANDAAAGLLEYDRKALINKDAIETIRLCEYISGRNITEEFFYTLEREGACSWEDNICLIQADNRRLPISICGSSIKDNQHRHLGHVIIFRDISERRRIEEKMRMLSTATEQTADSVMITDVDGVIQFVNPSFEKSTGYSREEVLGKKPSILKSGRHDQKFYANMWNILNLGEAYRDVFINRRKDNTLFHEDKTLTPLRDTNNKITGFLSVGSDITERMQVEKRIQYLATHDPLTNLPNRALFTDRLERAIVQRIRSGRYVAVLFLDLDRLKIINETLGHIAGDSVIINISKFLNGCIRNGDTLARFSGDEFAIILDNIASQNDVAPVARKLLDSIAQIIPIASQNIMMTASIGISVGPTDGQDSQQLIRNAETALDQAKLQGRNSISFFTSEMNTRAFERLSLEVDLRHALERDEYELYYQPIYRLAPNNKGCVLTKAEALLRWNHPHLGIVSPVDFIPVLEDTGLITEVGRWVLARACRQLVTWKNMHLSIERIAVNLSPVRFQQDDLAEDLLSIIGKTGASPSDIELEITESVLLQSQDRNMNMINTMSQAGLRFSIDDFGTGYSSLNYLARLPVTSLKIDRTFTREIPQGEQACEIIRAIITLGHTLALEVIGEGIENQQQLDFMMENKCDYIQGFLLSPPLPANEMEALLRADT